jgi:hypothetical protein
MKLFVYSDTLIIFRIGFSLQNALRLTCQINEDSCES